MLETAKQESELSRSRSSELYGNLLAHQKRLEDTERDLFEHRERARTLQVSNSCRHKCAQEEMGFQPLEVNMRVIVLGHISYMHVYTHHDIHAYSLYACRFNLTIPCVRKNSLWPAKSGSCRTQKHYVRSDKAVRNCLPPSKTCRMRCNGPKTKQRPACKLRSMALWYVNCGLESVSWFIGYGSILSLEKLLCILPSIPSPPSTLIPNSLNFSQRERDSLRRRLETEDERYRALLAFNQQSIDQLHTELATEHKSYQEAREAQVCI